MRLNGLTIVYAFVCVNGDFEGGKSVYFCIVKLYTLSHIKFIVKEMY